MHIYIDICIFLYIYMKTSAGRAVDEACAAAEALLPVKSRCSVLLLILLSTFAILWEGRGN